MLKWLSVLALALIGIAAEAAYTPPSGGGGSCAPNKAYCVGWYNAVSYGANNNDGSCIATAATTAAINTAASVAEAAGGGVVYLPAGTYCVSTLTTFTSGVVLQGDGKENTVLLSKSTTGDLLSTNGNFNVVKDLTLRTGSVRTAGAAIRMSGAHNQIQNVVFDATVGTDQWFDAIVIDDAGGVLGNSWDYTLQDIEGFYVDHYEITLGTSFGGSMQNVTFGGGPTGITPAAAVVITNSNSWVMSNVGFASIQNGLEIVPGAGDLVYAIYMDSVFFDAVTPNTGILIRPTTGGSYATSGVVYEVRGDKVWTSDGTSNNGFEIDGAVVGGKQLVSDVKFQNAIARSGSSGSAGTGFFVNGAQDVTVVNSVFSGFGQGMAVGAGTNDVSFIGNSSGAYGNPGPNGYPGGTLPNGTGIVVSASTDYIVVTDNRLDGNTSAALTNASTGGHTLICNNAGSATTLNCGGGGGGSGTVNNCATSGYLAYYATGGTAVSCTTDPTVTTLTATGTASISIGMTANNGLYCTSGCGGAPQNLIYGSAGGITWLGSPPGSSGGVIVAQNTIEPGATGTFTLGVPGDVWQQAYVNVATIGTSATINSNPALSGSGIVSGRCAQFSGTAGVVGPAAGACGTISGVTAGNQLTGGGSSGAVTLNVSATPSFTSVTTAQVNNTNAHAYLGEVADGTVFIGNVTNVAAVSSIGDFLPNGDNIYHLGGTSFKWIDVWAVNGTIQTSDLALKDIVGTETLGTDFIRCLDPVSYRWKTDAPGTEASHGFVAQQVKSCLGDKEFSGLIKPNTADEHWGLRYSDLEAPIVQMEKELDQRVSMNTGLIGLLFGWNLILTVLYIRRKR